MSDSNIITKSMPQSTQIVESFLDYVVLATGATHSRQVQRYVRLANEAIVEGRFSMRVQPDRVALHYYIPGKPLKHFIECRDSQFHMGIYDVPSPGKKEEYVSVIIPMIDPK